MQSISDHHSLKLRPLLKRPESTHGSPGVVRRAGSRRAPPPPIPASLNSTRPHTTTDPPCLASPALPSPPERTSSGPLLGPPPRVSSLTTRGSSLYEPLPPHAVAVQLSVQEASDNDGDDEDDFTARLPRASSDLLAGFAFDAATTAVAGAEDDAGEPLYEAGPFQSHAQEQGPTFSTETPLPARKEGDDSLYDFARQTTVAGAGSVHEGATATGRGRPPAGAGGLAVNPSLRRGGQLGGRVRRSRTPSPSFGRTNPARSSSRKVLPRLPGSIVPFPVADGGAGVVDTGSLHRGAGDQPDGTRTRSGPAVAPKPKPKPRRRSRSAPNSPGVHRAAQGRMESGQQETTRTFLEFSKQLNQGRLPESLAHLEGRHVVADAGGMSRDLNDPGGPARTHTRNDLGNAPRSASHQPISNAPPPPPPLRLGSVPATSLSTHRGRSPVAQPSPRPPARKPPVVPRKPGHAT